MNSWIWLVIACIAVWLCAKVWKLRREAEQASFETSNEDCSDEDNQIPKDIYMAIEAFAALGHMWKQKTGWEYDARDFAIINVKHSVDQTTLKMQYRGDCIALAMTGSIPEIHAESDNIIKFESSDVSSYDPTNPNALWEAFKRRCPNAELSQITQDSTGTWVFIRFE